MPLRRRLVLLSAAVSAVAVLAATVGSYLAVRSELRSEVDEVLTSQADAIKVLADNRGRLLLRIKDLPKESESGVPLPPGIANIRFQRVLPDGTSSAPEGQVAKLPVTDEDRRIAVKGEGQTLRDVDLAGENYRLLTVGLNRGGAIQLARSLRGVDDVLSGLRIVLGLVLLGAVLLAAGLSWFLSRRAMAPIARLTDAAEHISETHDLSRRIPPSGEDEVGRLASRFNQMLDTIENSQVELAASVVAQRRLVADASHELRTPVASLRTDIEALLQHPEVGAMEQTSMLESANARLGELTALITDIIELARGEEPNTEVEETRFDDLVLACVEHARAAHPRRRFETDLERTIIVGRPDRISRAISNLLSNAAKYSPEGSPVRLTMRSGVLNVKDSGEGIPDDEIPYVFDRFFRGRNSRDHPGSGLGLAIVKQVALAGGGDAWADPRTGEGASINFRPAPAARVLH